MYNAMMQLVAKLIVFLAFFGLSAPLITTFTYLGAMLRTNDIDIYG
jgi:hypothetical protein